MDMLSANIKITNIDYEKTFEQVFPLLREKISSMDSKNLIIRLFQKLDDAALPVMLGIMNRLPEDSKTEMMVLCLNTYSVKIKEKLNEELAKHSIGKYMRVGCVSIVQQDNALYLWIGQIQMDYKGLVKEKLSGKLGGIAAFLAGEKLEKMALELLWTEESKQKLLEAARNVIEKYGFAIELADVQLMQDKTEIVDAIETAVHLHLTEKMETDILDALAGYLKESVMGQSPVLSEEE